jgi:hypothetical protein
VFVGYFVILHLLYLYRQGFSLTIPYNLLLSLLMMTRAVLMMTRAVLMMTRAVLMMTLIMIHAIMRNRQVIRQSLTIQILIIKMLVMNHVLVKKMRMMRQAMKIIMIQPSINVLLMGIPISIPYRTPKLKIRIAIQ